MNLVGKIFAVLVLVMSLLFMGFSVTVYSMHKNWMDVAVRPRSEVAPGKPLGLKWQLEDARAENQRLQAQFDQIKNDISSEQAARRQQLAKLESEKDALQTDRDALATKEAQLQNDLRQAVASVQTAQTALDGKLKEIDALRGEIDKVRGDRNDQFTQVVALTDRLHQLEGELKRLEFNQLNLVEQLAKAKDVLSRNDLNIESPPSAPKLDGVVLASSDKGLVEISLGSNDGIERGYKLVVFRHERDTSKYLGQIQVLEVRPNKAVAQVIPELQQGIIEKDDRVATRFN